jgi:hypothetical protein
MKGTAGRGLPAGNQPSSNCAGSQFGVSVDRCVAVFPARAASGGLLRQSTDRSARCSSSPAYAQRRSRPAPPPPHRGLGQVKITRHLCRRPVSLPAEAHDLRLEGGRERSPPAPASASFAASLNILVGPCPSWMALGVAVTCPTCDEPILLAALLEQRLMTAWWGSLALTRPSAIPSNRARRPENATRRQPANCGSFVNVVQVAEDPAALPGRGAAAGEELSSH